MPRSVQRGRIAVNPLEKLGETDAPAIGEMGQGGERRQGMASFDGRDIGPGQRLAKLTLGQAGPDASPAQLLADRFGKGGERGRPPDPVEFRNT
jgi:hypothetical protein